MKYYYDLETNVLSCLLQKPELMKDLILEDKHFVKQQRLWQFMKSFYAKFETFDLVLMFQVCKDKFRLIQYLEWLTDAEPIISNFDKYQNQLIELYEQSEKERVQINLIYEKANDLYVGKIDLDCFIREINKIIEGVDR